MIYYSEQLFSKVENSEFNLLMAKVAYSDDMPIRTFENESSRDVIYKYFLTKASGWKYENEYRCISYKKGSGIHLFDTSLITAVYAGVKMTNENFSKLQRIVSDFSISSGKKFH